MNLEAATQRGAALLDQKRPGWARTIDRKLLDMRFWKTCIVGQVEGTDFLTGFRNLSAGTDCFEYGFISIYSHDYPKLTALWHERIKERLAAA